MEWLKQEEHLPSKCEVLSSNPSTAKKKSNCPDPQPLCSLSSKKLYCEEVVMPDLLPILSTHIELVLLPGCQTKREFIKLSLI
jgi:hypothetical protein